MAIFKILDSSTKSCGGMRNCMEYQLRDTKTTSDYIYMMGPNVPDEITWDSAYQAFMDEKKLWGKTDGRTHVHSLLSFHKDENITPELVMAFAKEFAEQNYAGFQTLIAVHKDRDHLHAHMVVNSVSYLDGHKIHQNKKDLQTSKKLVNDMCKRYGFKVAQKGKHFDGSPIEDGTIIAWEKDKYQYLTRHLKESFMYDCGMAVVNASAKAQGVDEFVSMMSAAGWKTVWSDTRMHVTFENADGKKVRDSNLAKTFSLNINKESLLQTFELNKPVFTEDMHIAEILMGYVDMRKNERNSWSIKAQQNCLCDDLEEISHLIVVAQNEDIKSVDSLAYKLRQFENQLSVAKRYHAGDYELYNIIMDAKKASKVMKKHRRVYDQYEKKILQSSKDKFRKTHLKAITEYEEAYKVFKKSEEYWSGWTLDEKVDTVMRMKTNADAEIKPLEKRVEELSYMARCVKKMIPGADVSINPLAKQLKDGNDKSKKLQKEREQQRATESQRTSQKKRVNYYSR